MNDRQLYDFLSRQSDPEISRRYFIKWLTKTGVGGAAALSLASVAFPACVPIEPPAVGPLGNEGGGDELLVGVVGAFSGIGAFVGRIVERAMAAAVGRINETGGINGRKVNWLRGDAETDTQKARQFFTQYSQNPSCIGVMFCTPLGISESRSDIRRGHVPTIATFSDLFSSGQLYPVDPNAPRPIFQMIPPGRWMLENVAAYSKNDRGYSRVGVLYLSLLSGNFENEAKNAAAKFGLEITGIEQFQLNSTDLGPQLQRLRSTNCDALWLFGLPNDTANIVRSLAALDASYIDTPTAKSGSGWHPQLMGDPAGMGERQWAVLAGDAAKVGTISSYHIGGLLYLPQFELTPWVQKYAGVDPTGGEDGPADSFYTLVKAVEDAGTTDRIAVVDAIENGGERRFSGLPFEFTPTDHLARHPDDMITITLERNRPEPTDPPYQLGREWAQGLAAVEFNPTHLVRPTMEANRRRHPEVIAQILRDGFGTQCTKEPDGTLSPRCKIH